MRRSGGRRTTHVRRVLAARLLASFVVALVVASGVTGAVERSRAASAPNIVSYQGRVLNANGVPVSDSTASMKFEIYTASSGGTCLWSNSSATCDSNTPGSTTARTVTLTDGLFSENLGDTAAATPYAAISDSVFADNAATYLQVYINGETLTPRKQVAAAPYAINSDTLDGLNSTSTGSTSAAVPVFDSSGNLVITGNPSGSGVSAGSLFVNPASLDLATDDTLFGVANGGASRFRVDAEGDTALLGDLIVGGTSLASPFSVDESLNTVRIGDGANDGSTPNIVFYASDASDSGTLSFTDSDVFSFTGGNFLFTGNGLVPTVADSSSTDFDLNSTFSGTSGNTLDTISMFGSGSVTTYSGVEGTATDHQVAAQNNYLSVSGASTTLTYGFASLNRLVNSSSNGSVIQGTGYMAVIQSEFEHTGATDIENVYGIHSQMTISSNEGSNIRGIFSEITAGAGTIAAGYAGYFANTEEGTVRYGVYSKASGGTTNYAGYFDGFVYVAEGSGAETLATGAGELYVEKDFEADGSISLGDGSGLDSFTFTSDKLVLNGAAFTYSALTSGTGMLVQRSAGGSDFSGQVMYIDQANTSGTTSGDALVVQQQSAGGDAMGVYIVQAQVTDETNGAGGSTIGGQALTIEIQEAASNDDAVLMRTAGNLVFAIESDGSVLSDNSYSGGGADFAEYFITRDATIDTDEVVCVDRLHVNAVKRCEAGNTEVVGVVSSTPGFIGNLPDNPDTAPMVIVGLVGQVSTQVTANEGAISIGDPITASMTLPGFGAKANGPVRIVGYALESLSSGTGTIKVYVHPTWYGADALAADGSVTEVSTDLALASLGAATASMPGVDSATLALRGSAWNGVASVERSMSLVTDVQAVDDYRLSVRNADGVEVAYINDAGDLSVSGRLYPSDRGTAQSSKYIYYDGSEGGGGDFMRTNAAGWGTGSYDFAEMFASADVLVPGDVVLFGDAKEQVKRSTGTKYDQLIAGVVSTRPGFLAGDNKKGQFPIALAGRVPTKVSGENGSIAIGDPLTTSSRPGFAMKATEAGPILGYATEAFAGDSGSIIAFINVSYYDGGPVDPAPEADNVVSGLAAEITNFDVSGALNLNGGSILSVATLQGIGNRWRVEEDGDFVTYGRLVQLVRSHANEDVETYAAATREMTVQLTGTAMLQDGVALVDFEQIDPKFNDIIAAGAAYRVFLTPYGSTGMLYTTNRSQSGFMITESGSMTSGVAVDWFVVAYHKDYAPETPVVEDVLAPEQQEEEVSPIAESEPEEATPPVDEAPVEEVESEENVVVDEESDEIVEEAPVVEEHSATMEGE